MNAAAKAVVADLPEITIAYGVSDEYRSVPQSSDEPIARLIRCSFVFHKACTIFERRARYVSPIALGGFMSHISQ